MLVTMRPPPSATHFSASSTRPSLFEQPARQGAHGHLVTSLTMTIFVRDKRNFKFKVRHPNPLKKAATEEKMDVKVRSRIAAVAGAAERRGRRVEERRGTKRK